MKLVEGAEGKEGELPGVDSCALEEGEDEGGDAVLIKDSKGARFFKKLKNKMKKVSTWLYHLFQKMCLMYYKQQGGYTWKVCCNFAGRQLLYMRSDLPSIWNFSTVEATLKGKSMLSEKYSNFYPPYFFVAVGGDIAFQSFLHHVFFVFFFVSKISISLTIWARTLKLIELIGSEE